MALSSPAIFKLSSPLFATILGSHLSAYDIAVGFAQTCKVFGEIVRQEQVWKLWCLVATGAIDATPFSWLREAKLLLRIGTSRRLQKDRILHAVQANDL